MTAPVGDDLNAAYYDALKFAHHINAMRSASTEPVDAARHASSAKSLVVQIAWLFRCDLISWDADAALCRRELDAAGVRIAALTEALKTTPARKSQETQTALVVVPFDVRHWPFFPIEMPLDADGNGPCKIADAVRVTYEVWDHVCHTHGKHQHLPAAIAQAMMLSAQALETSSETAEIVARAALNPKEAP